MKVVLKYCPQSVEVCSSSGQTLLHLLKDHEDLKQWLDIPEIHGLKNYQDKDGNTPAHIAAKNRCIGMLQLLLRMSPNFCIKNNEGVSAIDLMSFEDEEWQKLYDQLHIRTMFVGTSLRDVEERMKRLKEITGNTQLRELGLIGTLLHSLMAERLWGRDDIRNLIEDTLKSCPFLICETSIYGYTPLHILILINQDFIDEPVLEFFKHYYEKVVQRVDCGEHFLSQP